VLFDIDSEVICLIFYLFIYFCLTLFISFFLILFISVCLFFFCFTQQIYKRKHIHYVPSKISLLGLVNLSIPNYKLYMYYPNLLVVCLFLFLLKETKRKKEREKKKERKKERKKRKKEREKERQKQLKKSIPPAATKFEFFE